MRFNHCPQSFQKVLFCGVAIDYALGWVLDNIWARVSHLAGTLRTRLRQIPRAQVHNLGLQKCGLVTFTINGAPSPEIRRKLAGQKMNVSVSTAASTRLDMDQRGLASLLRALVHYYNTDEEIDRFCDSVTRMI